MSIVEFLLARIAEDEEAARAVDPVLVTRMSEYAYWHEVNFVMRFNPARVLTECAAKRKIVELHSRWPVLVEGPMNFDPVETNFAIDNYALRVSKQVAWLTEQEYVKRFGVEPPTAPMLRALASVYADHPDYQEAWA